MKARKTIWKRACEYESERRGGMQTILDFLLSLHCTTPEAQADLRDAFTRFEEQMRHSPKPL